MKLSSHDLLSISSCESSPVYRSTSSEFCQRPSIMSNIMGCLTFLLSTPLYQYLLRGFATVKYHLLLDGTTITAPGLVFVGVEPCSSTLHATLTDSTSIAGSLVGFNGSGLASNIGSVIGNFHGLGLIRHSCGCGIGVCYRVQPSALLRYLWS